LSDFNEISYVGRLWCPELIPDINIFFTISIFMVTGRNFSMSRINIWDILIYPHNKFWWYRTMLNFCGIVVAILRMAIGRNFSMSGINSGHHYLPTWKRWR
jgi:hypothetical protein